jgi:hypothetical protein
MKKKLKLLWKQFWCLHIDRYGRRASLLEYINEIPNGIKDKHKSFRCTRCGKIVKLKTYE